MNDLPVHDKAAKPRVNLVVGSRRGPDQPATTSAAENINKQKKRKRAGKASGPTPDKDGDFVDRPCALSEDPVEEYELGPDGLEGRKKDDEIQVPKVPANQNFCDETFSSIILKGKK